MEMGLLEQLKQYSTSDYYPFHMPGHKRNPEVDYLPAEMDITEIEGFDNLHHATGVLAQAQARAAALYGSEEAFFLVNGSTCGILAAISAALPFGGHILMARNSHKAAYHAVFLRGLEVSYIYPDTVGGYGVCGGITPQEVQSALQKKDIQAVFLTSPTYEGMVSNIREIADIAHEKGAVLIVDEAHGAHFHIGGDAFPESAIHCGADIVIQSLHKTLPSMTQTALLHVQGNRIRRSFLRKYLQIYQTSSPSYVMMAGIDSCLRWLEVHGKERFKAYAARLEQFYVRMEELKYLQVLKPNQVQGRAGIHKMDPSKICIFTNASGWSGRSLYEYLLDKYHLQLEMAAGNYVIAMTSVMDTEEGFRRLEQALLETDRQLGKNKSGMSDKTNDRILPKAIVSRRSADMEKYMGTVCLLEESVGAVSSEYRYIYPPGVPVLAPGEVITDEVVKLLRYYEEQQLEVFGSESGRNHEIRCCREADFLV